MAAKNVLFKTLTRAHSKQCILSHNPVYTQVYLRSKCPNNTTSILSDNL